jgi:hypothetical protein
MQRSIRAASMLVAMSLAHLGLSFAADAAEMQVEHLEGGYSIEIPEALSIRQVRNVGDFSLYRVVNSAGKELLMIYLGNFPAGDFKPPRTAVHSLGRIGGYAETSDRWIEKNATHNAVTLIQLAGGGGWPQVAQFSFRGLTASDSKLAEKIVQSFRRNQTQE